MITYSTIQKSQLQGALEEAKRKVEEMIDSTSSLRVEKGGKN